MNRTNHIQLLPIKYCSEDNINCKSCNHVDDRDVVGAKNILFKGMYGLESVHRDEIVPLEVIT